MIVINDNQVETACPLKMQVTWLVSGTKIEASIDISSLRDDIQIWTHLCVKVIELYLPE